jgi:adenylyl cyclase-associated protein
LRIITQVRGKVNAISMDKCRRVGLVFGDVVASCELVNCTSVEVQCTGRVATVAIDKCDGCQVGIALHNLVSQRAAARH